MPSTTSSAKSDGTTKKCLPTLQVVHPRDLVACPSHPPITRKEIEAVVEANVWLCEVRNSLKKPNVVFGREEKRGDNCRFPGYRRRITCLIFTSVLAMFITQRAKGSAATGRSLLGRNFRCCLEILFCARRDTASQRPLYAYPRPNEGFLDSWRFCFLPSFFVKKLGERFICRLQLFSLAVRFWEGVSILLRQALIFSMMNCPCLTQRCGYQVVVLLSKWSKQARHDQIPFFCMSFEFVSRDGINLIILNHS